MTDERWRELKHHLWVAADKNKAGDPRTSAALYEIIREIDHQRSRVSLFEKSSARLVEWCEQNSTRVPDLFDREGEIPTESFKTLRGMVGEVVAG